MSDSHALKWAGWKIDEIAPDGLSFEEAVALIHVLSERIVITVHEARPPVDEYGTSYPRILKQ